MEKKYKKITKPLGETKFIRLKLPIYLQDLSPNIIKYIGPKRIIKMEKSLSNI